MATHSSVLAWRIPWTEGLAGCSPWGHRVGHDRVTNTHTQHIQPIFIFKNNHINTRGNFIHANIINMLYLGSRIMKLNTVCLVFHFYKY